MVSVVEYIKERYNLNMDIINGGGRSTFSFMTYLTMMVVRCVWIVPLDNPIADVIKQIGNYVIAGDNGLRL